MTDKERNDVPATEQVAHDAHIRVYGDGGGLRVLFVGNSISLHAPAPQLGWQGDWGMAASCAENDYVHRALRIWQEKYGKATGCVCQVSEWERDFMQDAPGYFAAARGFAPHITVVRIGDNISPQCDGILLRRQLGRAVRFLANGSPVVATDSFWRSPPVDDAIRAAAQQNGWTFVPISDLGDDPAMKAVGRFASEGVCLHPSDAGMAEIARRIADAVAALPPLYDRTKGE